MPVPRKSSLRSSSRNSRTKTNKQLSWTSNRPKKIFTSVPNENAWQTKNELASARRSPDDQEPKYVKVPVNYDDVNTKWRLEYDTNRKGNRLYQLYKNNRRTMLLSAAALGGIVAAVIKSRKRGGSKRGGSKRGGSKRFGIKNNRQKMTRKTRKL